MIIFSCDVVTSAVRIESRESKSESQIQNSYNIKNLLDLGKISIAALEGELNKICWESILQSLTKPGQTLDIHSCQLP